MGLDDGQCSPDFTLPDRDGTPVTLSDFRGTVHVVELAAMWCEPCFDLAPQLQALVDAHHAAGFTVVTMITQDARGANPTLDDAARWVDDLGVTYPVVVDTLGIVQADWQERPGILEVPKSYVMDRDGVIRWSSIDEDTQAMSLVVEQLIAE